MPKFVQVRDSELNIVQLNIDHIVVMRTRGVGFSARMIIKDVLGKTYLSLKTPEDFKIKIGAEE